MRGPYCRGGNGIRDKCVGHAAEEEMGNIGVFAAIVDGRPLRLSVLCIIWHRKVTNRHNARIPAEERGNEGPEIRSKL